MGRSMHNPSIWFLHGFAVDAKDAGEEGGPTPRGGGSRHWRLTDEGRRRGFGFGDEIAPVGAWWISMAHNRRNGGGYRMEGRDNNADMEEIKRMINQLAACVARIETRSQDSDGGSFDGERDVNPFRNDGGNSRRGFDMKVDIPEFEGRMRPDDFVDWLNTVERVFKYKEIPDEKRVKIVAIKLIKHAFAWWEQLRVHRERLGKPKIKTWEKMRKELRKKFT
ncbi:hypothetical protein ACLB2K_008566 [Fragaria x ananassa]